MTPFLHLVAQDLHEKFGSDFSRIAIVFPNKRAGLFMNEYLVEISGGAPVWAPRYMTINDLFFSLSPDRIVNDTIDTTLRIVRLFQQITGDASISVERFYGWAERILADFDDVDKNMADAKALFRNISELKAFEDNAFLSPEQVEELRKFFRDFDPDKKSELREKFQQLWEALGPIYQSLNAELAEKGRAYEGALYRRVVERLEAGELEVNPSISHFVFVGFNVLDKVEQNLFKYLKDKGRALFYWDYDTYYVDMDSRGSDECKNEAGLFLRENVKRFPNVLSHEYFSNLEKPKKVEMIAASTEAIQAQYVAPWLKENLTPDAKRTAVVLCNENLLQPVLHGLPESIKELNVTKGFPLSHTEVVTEVERQLGDWERHNTKLPIAELLARLSAKVEEDGRAFVSSGNYSKKRFEDILQGEAYFMMYTILNRFATILAEHSDLAMTIVTLRRLIRQVVRQSSIPFHGEPVEGLQVMGVLETRCLDFDHVIMLSVNDGMLPRKASDNSFIPYLLRRAYELTTPERRTAVYAYYFYRLLQRASVVTLTYNNSTNGMSTGEMSRFMTQLLVEWPGKVEHSSLNSLQHTETKKPQPVKKPADIVKEFMKSTNADPTRKVPSLSPSALSEYLRCQLKFYYRHVKHLHEPEKVTEELPNNVFGSLFHRAAELVYEHIIEKHNGIAEPDYLLALANSAEAMHRYVKKAFDENKDTDYRVLEARVLELYLANLLRCDARAGRFKVVGTERKVEGYVSVSNGGVDTEFRINGSIDRLDFIRNADGTNSLRVFDYKTGSADANSSGAAKDAVANSLDDLFEPEKAKGYMLQTFLYGTMLSSEAKHDKEIEEYIKHPVMPSLFYLKLAQKSNYNPLLFVGKEEVRNVFDYSEDFTARLKALIEEIIDTSRPFNPPSKQKYCPSCPYRMLCFKADNEA